MTNIQLAQTEIITGSDLEEIYSGTGFKFVGQPLGSLFSPDLFTLIFTGAGLIAFIFFAIAGFQLMTSQGDPKKLSDAKNRLLYSVIGFVIIFSAYWITTLVGQILGFSKATTIFQ